MHLIYWADIEDFSLEEFKEKEEVDYLIQDYPQFEILTQIDIIIAFLHMSPTAERLSAGGEQMRDKINEFIKFNAIKMDNLY
jgi:hypothetical protein